MDEAKELQMFDSYCTQGREIFVRKNKAYGGSYHWMGLIGVVSEIAGISMRLVSAVFNNFGNIESNRESVKDALLDLHNYANMGLICLENDNILGEFLQGAKKR